MTRMTIAGLLMIGLAAAAAAQEPPPSMKTMEYAAAPVNLNTATAQQLETLPGIGAATAQRIIEYRLKNGSFTKIEELINVRGVGEKSFHRRSRRSTGRARAAAPYLSTGMALARARAVQRSATVALRLEDAAGGLDGFTRLIPNSHIVFGSDYPGNRDRQATWPDGSKATRASRPCSYGPSTR